MKIYIASKTKHAAKWRNLRSQGFNIISTWIDEAGAGESKDLSDLAIRCVNEAKTADRLILYCEDSDILKGALIEVGAALAAGVRCFVVGYSPSLETALNRHPLWIWTATLKDALPPLNNSVDGDLIHPANELSGFSITFLHGENS